MSELTTDAMVDEAAEAAYTMAAWDAQNFTGTNWAELDPAHRTPWLREAEAAPEAAAPAIAAKALRDAATDTDGLLDLLVAEDDSQFAYGSAHGIGPDGSVEFMTEGPWGIIGGGEYVTGVGVCIGPPEDGAIRSRDAALIADARTSLTRALDALEAVLAPHQLHEVPGGQRWCLHCGGDWPCPTVDAAETALRGES